MRCGTLSGTRRLPVRSRVVLGRGGGACDSAGRWRPGRFRTTFGSLRSARGSFVKRASCPGRVLGRDGRNRRSPSPASGCFGKLRRGRERTRWDSSGNARRLAPSRRTSATDTRSAPVSNAPSGNTAVGRAARSLGILLASGDWSSRPDSSGMSSAAAGTPRDPATPPAAASPPGDPGTPPAAASTPGDPGTPPAAAGWPDDAWGSSAGSGRSDGSAAPPPRASTVIAGRPQEPA
jgi:hypothetical protein